MSRPTIDHRDQILATAEKLIYENGIHATGMDLLVKTSGVSRKGIYNHFATKDDIAAAALGPATYAGCSGSGLNAIKQPRHTLAY